MPVSDTSGSSGSGTPPALAAEPGEQRSPETVVIGERRSPETIVIYVRKGADDNERRLTFKRLEGISALELLDRGLAIDGDQAACSITGHFDRSDGAWTFTYPTFEPSGFAGDVGAVATQDTGDLISALLYAERRLANFLRELGYNVEFAL